MTTTFESELERFQAEREAAQAGDDQESDESESETESEVEGRTPIDFTRMTDEQFEQFRAASRTGMFERDAAAMDEFVARGGSASPWDVEGLRAELAALKEALGGDDE